MTNSWIPLPEAAARMNFSRDGALKRLRRLEASSGERILRRTGGRWEVSLHGLTRALDDSSGDSHEATQGRLRVIEERLEALRRTGAKFRKSTTERFEKNERALKKLAQANMAATEAIEELLK